MKQRISNRTSVWTRSLPFLLVSAAATFAALGASPARAGCGCQKAPPEAASLRPNATYAGAPVTIFHPSLSVGKTYSVTFSSGTQVATKTLSAVAVQRRDLADGVYKPQLVVALPALPLGPTSVTVQSKSLKFAIGDTALTVASAPLALSEDVGEVVYPGARAAVGRDGTVYLALDMTNLSEARSFEAQALGLPLVFTSDDVVFYNVQGFLMQLLNSSMPGLYSVESTNSPVDSDVLGYRRHEFNTHFLQHGENQVHAVDPTDPNWHLDGTRHIDHDHQILAIAASLFSGTALAPGTTPAFNLRLSTETLFEEGVFGADAVDMRDAAEVDSFDSSTGASGEAARLGSNQNVQIGGDAVLHGNASAPSVNVGPSATVTGRVTQANGPGEMMSFSLPDNLEQLGAVSLTDSQSMVLTNGSYEAKSIHVSGSAALNIDNSAGPVTIYVTDAIDAVTIQGYASVTASDSSAEAFAIYVVNGGTVDIDEHAVFYGVVYAPGSQFLLQNEAEMHGAVVSQVANLEQSSRFHYDSTLSSQSVETPPPSCVGSCGAQNLSDGCWCDANCTSFGDCCGDFTMLCVDEGPVTY